MNNQDLLNALILYKEDVKQAELVGKEKPIIPDYIARCIMRMAEGLAMKPCFSGYPFVEDMKADGVKNSIEYLLNFDPDKTKNPFAYFTQVIYFAFIRRIEKEKGYLYSKFKAIENVNTFQGASGKHEYDFYADAYDDTIKQSEGTIEYMYDFINTYEEKKNDKKANSNLNRGLDRDNDRSNDTSTSKGKLSSNPKQSKG